ncbi:EH signature domain-containing protein [Shewanella gaetbuli]|uniref:EH signature domain-containing protein n=1 Tax=Shewanella gaetbuli TaxID=220752 RepID=A0A9X1ZJ00_9GAMM|nr:EH signature domain-containing protein [Shewanella gaetbuli]MCL1143214.1 EH signature domain-containing protein [Shewanella gaetbuli]
MKSNMFSFSLPELPSINGIDKDLAEDFLSIGGGEIILPSFPPKTLKEIVKLVDEGLYANISICEWLDVIENPLQWQNLCEDDVFDACRAVWTAICSNKILGNIAFFKVALALDGKPSSIVYQLLETMEIARTTKGLDSIVSQKIDWLLALYKSDFKVMILDCYSKKMTPKQRVKSLRLPLANTYIQKVASLIISVLQENLHTKSDVLWITSCFYSLDTTKDRIKYCDEFVRKLQIDTYGEVSTTIIEEHCLPMKKDTYWYELSVEARALLKRKFNLSNFFELKLITRMLCSQNAAQQLALEEFEQRQIKSRASFWSNYSERFNRIRVLLPQTSYEYIEEQMRAIPANVEVLKACSNFQTEILIFELEKVIIVEFLRGQFSETRIFKNIEWNAKALFNNGALSIKDILDFVQADIHDHLTSWQHFCEKLLREKYTILPNKRTEFFVGLPKTAARYSYETGIVKPSSTFLKDRAEKMEMWLRNFWKLELMNPKYGDSKELSDAGATLYSRAIVAKELDSEKAHMQLLEQAASENNNQAKWQLGLMLMQGTAPQRTKGEDLIMNIAEAGHKEAAVFAKAANLSRFAKKKLEFQKVITSLNTVRKIWIGYSSYYGWVILDRNLIQNQSGRKNSLLFQTYPGEKIFSVERANWNEPQFIYADKYVGVASDKDLAQLAKLLERY